jgi:acyl-CoA thioester hydrolase
MPDLSNSRVAASASTEYPRDSYRVLRMITTRWGDNDVYGHVNNVHYYAYFDTAVNGWLMAATGSDIRLLGAIGIVAETSCRYRKPISFPDQIHAGIALEKLGTRSVVYRIALFRSDDSDPSAVGRFVHVYVDAISRRAVEIPADIRRALQSL